MSDKIHPVIEAIIDADICTFAGMADVCDELAKYEGEQIKISELDEEIVKHLNLAIAAMQQARQHYIAASKAGHERIY